MADVTLGLPFGLFHLDFPVGRAANCCASASAGTRSKIVTLGGEIRRILAIFIMCGSLAGYGSYFSIPVQTRTYEK